MKKKEEMKTKQHPDMESMYKMFLDNGDLFELFPNASGIYERDVRFFKKFYLENIKYG